MVIGGLIIDNNREICYYGGIAVLHEVRPYSGRGSAEVF